MKITKRQLRRVIREAVDSLPVGGYSDAFYGDPAPAAIERDAIDMLNDILDDWDKDPKMSTGDEYYNRIVGVTKLLEG